MLRLLSLSLFAVAVVAPAADLSAVPVHAKDVLDPTTLTFAPYEKTSPKINLKAGMDNKLEKNALTLGMIKLTDCAPIVVARELGYFADEGLNVTVQVQPNWKAVQDRLLSGEIDGTHMLYGHPLGAAVGYNVPMTDIVVPYNMSINGMGITVSEGLFKEMAAKDATLSGEYAIPVSANAIKAVAAERKASGKPAPAMFMTFPAGSHNMTIRYWLAAGGINPGFYTGLDDPKGQKDADVLLTVNPPPQMASAIAAGNCEGFSVGEPWNMQVTIKDRTGRMVAPSQHVLDGMPDKVFAVTGAFAAKNPNTVQALTKALIRAGMWLDANKENRKKAVEMLAHKDYIGAKVEILAESMLGSLVYGMKGDKPDRRSEPEFNVFFRRFASFPYHSHGVWGLTQFRRWGMIPEKKDDAWYHSTAKKVFRADLYRSAYAVLVEEKRAPKDGLPESDMIGFPATAAIDRVAFDPSKPNDYLQAFSVGLK